MDQDDLEFFSGKWKWLDERAALHARKALQHIVDTELNGQQEIGIRTSVLVSVSIGSRRVNMLSSDIADADERARAFESALESKKVPPYWFETTTTAVGKVVGTVVKTILGGD